MPSFTIRRGGNPGTYNAFGLFFIQKNSKRTLFIFTEKIVGVETPTYKLLATCPTREGISVPAMIVA